MSNIVSLNEILEIQNGFAFDSTMFNDNGLGMPIIRIRDLARSHTETFYSGEYDQRFVVKKGDMLIGMDGEFRCYQWKGADALLNQRVCRLQNFSQKVVPKYVFYLINKYLVEIENKTTFVTVKHISSKQISTIQIHLPPLAEQERIVCLLDEAETLRKLRGQASTRMEQFVPALFYEMFGDPVNSHFPVKKLYEVADVVSGIAKGRKFNGQKSVTVNYLRVANVQAGYLDLSEIKTIEALPEEIKELQVRIGDVLLTEGGDFDKLGRGAMLDVDLPNCIHQNHVFRARVNQAFLIPDFFHDYLQTQQAKNYFLSCAKKTTNLASINLTQLRALPVPLPPLSLQREFAVRVQEARGVQSVQARSEERIEALYQSMLSRAFAGEL